MTLPLLTIIIPTINEAAHLPRLLGDLKKQQGISLEIIVGDGGSTDATCSVAVASGARFVNAPRGRGAQMNAAAKLASGDYMLFLHADTSIDNPSLLNNALRVIKSGHERTAGHFCLRFMCRGQRNRMGYRFAGEKSAFNRVNTTNGDQGLLLSKAFFIDLGGFDEGLPFLEDQRIAEKIRSRGELITLPDYLNTSARRFETEGFHRRYILMSMIMGLHSVGADGVFARLPGVYRVQQETGKLLLTPFFSLIRHMMRHEWGIGGTIRIFYFLGEYIRQNSWQMFFFMDVWLRPLLGVGHYPFLNFHDRVFAPCTRFRVFNALAGMGCFVWFIGILAPFFWLIECIDQKKE